MFAAIKSGSRRRAQERAEREQACIAAGCKCYCHEPYSIGAAALVIFAFFTLWTGLWWLASLAQRADYASHPPEPYYCTGLTSTGAPADCHPAVLPPDVLKKYESQFKQ